MPQFPFPPRGMLGKNTSTLGEESPQGDAETLLHPSGRDPKCLPQPQRGPGSPAEAVPPHRPITDAASPPSNFQSRHPKPRLALYGCLSPALRPGTPRHPDKPHVLPRSSLPGGDPPSPTGHRSRGWVLRAGWSSRMGTGRGQDTRWLCHLHQRVTAGRDGSRGLTPGPRRLGTGPSAAPHRGGAAAFGSAGRHCFPSR